MPSEHKENNAPRRMGHGPHGGAGEKPKDLKLALKKLVVSLKKYWTPLIIAFVLAALASIFTIAAPNKLSDLTNEITKGLVPNTEKLFELSNQITTNLNNGNIDYFISFNFSERNLTSILTDTGVSQESKENLKGFIDSLSFLEQNEILKEFGKLDRDIQERLLTETEISVEEQLSLIGLVTGKSSAEYLPEAVKTKLLTEFVYGDVVISVDDQIEFLASLGSLNEESTQLEIFQAIDKLPSNIYNIVEPKVDFTTIKNIVLFIAFLYITFAIFTFIEGLIMVHVSNNYSRGLRNNIAKKINKLPLRYFDRHTVGDTLSRVTNDVDTMSQSMNQSFSTLVSSIALLIGSVVMMFWTNSIMAATAIVASLIGFIFMFLILSKSQKYFVERQRELGNINGLIEDTFSGHVVVKLYNGKKDSDKAFDELNDKVFVCERKSQFLSGLMHPIMGFIGNFGYVAVCIVGALLVLNGHITFGVIVAFMIYVRLFTNPLTQLAQAMTSLQSTAAASERVFEFLGEEEMPNQEKYKKTLAKKDAKGEIVFDHVKFGYDDDKLIIKDFSAKVLPGQKIAIVGPTGAGKTTLVNLLMRFYEINSGDIRIDGISTKELTRENIHDLFIMVLQDTWLFNGTIRDNLKYNKDHTTDEDIKRACNVVGVEHYIKTLQHGLNSEITDANSISAGQKQLLTIARGMIEDAPFLILDEATSNVDTRTEELVQKAMDKLTEGRTSFIIAHRLSTIRNADLILVMNEGNIIEQGNHDELMKLNGFYANLYNSQFEKVTE